MLIPVPDDWSLVRNQINAGNKFIRAMEQMSKADSAIRNQGFDILLENDKSEHE